MTATKEDVVRTLREDLSDPCFICDKIVWWDTTLDPPEPEHMVLDFSDDHEFEPSHVWTVCSEEHGREAVLRLKETSIADGRERSYSYMRASSISARMRQP